MISDLTKRARESWGWRYPVFVNSVHSAFERSRAFVLGRGVTAYWYRETVNFGDLLTPALLLSYGYAPVRASERECQLTCVGSILQRIDSSYAGVILGSGLISEKYARSFPNAVILAVRGELTRSLLSADSGVVLGDPGLLACRLLKRRLRKQYRVGIVPHYVDARDARVASLSRRHKDAVCVIDVKRAPGAVVKDIAECECILSSSLHGLIVAESLGIPAGWLRLSDGLVGGEFKFHDYYSALGVERRCSEISGKESLVDLAAIARVPPSSVPKCQSELDALFKNLNNTLGVRPESRRLTAQV